MMIVFNNTTARVFVNNPYKMNTLLNGSFVKLTIKRSSTMIVYNSTKRIGIEISKLEMIFPIE